MARSRSRATSDEGLFPRRFASSRNLRRVRTMRRASLGEAPIVRCDASGAFLLIFDASVRDPLSFSFRKTRDPRKGPHPQNPARTPAKRRRTIEKPTLINPKRDLEIGAPFLVSSPFRPRFAFAPFLTDQRRRRSPT